MGGPSEVSFPPNSICLGLGQPGLGGDSASRRELDQGGGSVISGLWSAVVLSNPWRVCGTLGTI